MVLGLVAAIGLIATPAVAVELRGGDFQAHFTDGSTLYVDHDGDPATAMIPRAPRDIDPIPGDGLAPPGWADTVAAGGDENRAVFSVNQFLQNDIPYYEPPDGELTGLLYDLTLVRVDGDPVSGLSVLYFAPAGRNPVVDPEGGSLAAPPGSGGVLEVWRDPTPDGVGNTLFDPLGNGMAPQTWGEANVTGGVAAANHPVTGAADTYPTVNTDDAVLWLQAVLVPQLWIDLDGDGILETPIVMREVIDVATSSGSALLAWANITDGEAAPLFNRNYAIPGVDLTLASTFQLPGGPDFTGSPQDIGNWSILSSDPVRADIIPEPASMALLGLGLVGLVVRRRKK